MTRRRVSIGSGERPGDRSEQIPVVEGLGEEVHGPGLHRPRGHLGVAMACDEDDRQALPARRQRGLEIESAGAREPDVEHDTPVAVALRALEKLQRRGEDLGPIAGRPKQSLETTAHRGVVVHDEDGRLVAAHTGVPAHGSVKWKVAPRVALLVAQMEPPWAMTIDRAIGNPMPMPPGFVV